MKKIYKQIKIIDFDSLKLNKIYIKNKFRFNELFKFLNLN